MSDKPADDKKPGWVPTGKDGAVLLMLLGGGVGGYKLIDAAVERQVTENTALLGATAGKVTALSGRIEDIAKKLEQLTDAIAAMQSDRLRDLRTVYERGSTLQTAFETLSRQIADVKGSIDGVERRGAEADRDLKQSMSELRGEVNSALRAPLVGPRGR